LAQRPKKKKNADPGFTPNRRLKMKKANETVGVSSAFNSAYLVAGAGVLQVFDFI
jgi:hypothetical protein